MSEVLLPLIPGEHFVKYAKLRSVEVVVKNDIFKRYVIRRTVISLQDLPVSTGIKEKLAKPGIGLNEVFAAFGSFGNSTKWIKGSTCKKEQKHPHKNNQFL